MGNEAVFQYNLYCVYAFILMEFREALNGN